MYVYVHPQTLHVCMNVYMNVHFTRSSNAANNEHIIVTNQTTAGDTKSNISAVTTTNVTSLRRPSKENRKQKTTSRLAKRQSQCSIVNVNGLPLLATKASNGSNCSCRVPAPQQHRHSS